MRLFCKIKLQDRYFGVVWIMRFITIEWNMAGEHEVLSLYYMTSLY